MKKASRDGNHAGAGIGIRFSVLLLAVSMLISTPAYSFATSAQDANGGSEPAVTEETSAQDANGGSEPAVTEETSAQDANGGSEPAVTEETNAPDDQNGQNSDQGSDQASGSQTDGTDRSGQSGSTDDQKGTDAANSGSEKTDPDTGSDKTDRTPAKLRGPLLGATSNGNVGTDLVWEISEAGVLTISPAEGKETGTLPSSPQDWASNPPDQSRLAEVYPWHQYSNDITSIVIKDGVKAGKEARYMFYNLPNLTEADLTKLDASELGVSNDMFRSCPKLKEVSFSGDFMPKQMNRMFQADSGSSSLSALTFGTKEDPMDPASLSRSSNTPPFQSMNNIFSGCENLTTLNFPRADFSTQHYYVQQVPNLLNAFNGANSKGKTLGVEDADIGSWMSKRIFRGSNLETVNARGVTIDHDLLRALFHAGDSDLTPASSKLKTVDMTSAKFTNADASAFNMFRNIKTLETVKLTDAEFPDTCTNYETMFRDCTGLKRVEMTDEDSDNNGKSLRVKGAVKMGNMFSGCSSLEHLDISGFGKLEHIMNMDGFLQGCSSLEELILDNLDNSVIPVTMPNHPDPGSVQPGRMMFGTNTAEKNLPALKILSARNSKIWFVKQNTSGMPGQEYYNAAIENDLVYLTKKKTIFKSDVTGSTKSSEISCKRDWIDLITDRHEQPEGSGSFPDKRQNINIKDGHLNTNGAGFLAPGVYTITENDWAEPELKLQQTYYRISNIEDSTPRVDKSDDRLQYIGDEYIRTNRYTKDEWDDIAEIDGNNRILKKDDGSPMITLTYPDAAVDIYGNKHNVTVKINGITFKDVNKIPENPHREHDPNNYQYGDYSRTVLKYGKGFLMFQNYVQDYDRTALSGGSGTDIDFTIEIEGALPGTSVLFYMDDLDIAKAQDWNKPEAGDWCYDNLPFENNTYGSGSEGMVLGYGNDLDTISFAKHTGLEVVNGNEVVSTGQDPNTAWSAFSVRADAAKSSYRWTSGIACDTYLLKQTEGPEPPEPVYVMPEASKLVNNATPSGKYADKYFTYDFKKAGSDVNPHNYTDYAGRLVDVSGLTNQADSSTQTKENTNGVVVFDTLSYESPGGVGKKLYLYEISERQGSTEHDIIAYDSTKHYMQVVVSDPVTDLELYRGTRAEIILGSKKADGPIVWNTSRTITVWASDAREAKDEEGQPIIGPGGSPVFIDANGTRFYRDMTTGELKPYDGSGSLTSSTRATTDRIVYFKKEGRDVNVKIDHNGVEYIKGSDSKYYSPDDQQPLMTAKSGDIDPNKTAIDRVVPEARTVTVGGETRRVRKDIHGVEYYVLNGKYYDPSGNTEITVKDGVFNPGKKVTGEGAEAVTEYTDKIVYKDKTVTVGGSEYKVYRHFNGKEYYAVTSGSETKYYSPDGTELSVKTEGEVDPHDDDANAVTARNEYKERRETVTGNSYVIYRDKNGIEYFRKSGGILGGIYYTPYNTLLEEGENGFAPDVSDPPAYHTYEIWIDSEGNEYYKNDRGYFDISGHKFELAEGTLDTSEIVNTAVFRNEVKTSEISIKKESAASQKKVGGKFRFEITFDSSFNPEKAGYFYIPASTAKPEQISKKPNTWAFYLEEGQELKLRNVPFGTKYSVKEVSQNGFELDGIKTAGEATQSVSDIVIRKQKTDADYDRDYEHEFTNRMTQIIVDKTIDKNGDTTTDFSKEEFEYTASVTKTGLNEGEQISFGWLQQDEAQEFKTAEAGSDGTASGTIKFKLKDGEDIALVVPQGAEVSVTEDTQTYLTYVKKDNGEETESRTITVDGAQNTEPLTALHFRNRYVKPLTYNNIWAKKVIDNHAFMSGYQFEIALVPITKDAPLPEEQYHWAADGDYGRILISSSDTPDGEGENAGYKKAYGPITYTNSDAELTEDGQTKTFSYYLREMAPQEGSIVDPTGVKRAPGLTYSVQRYQVDVTVKLVKTAAELKLVEEETAIYKMKKNEQGIWEPDKSESGRVDMAVFNNVYDPNTSAYRMVADKILTNKELHDGDYTFIMRPFGANKDKAPMPLDKVREEGGVIKVYDVGTEEDEEGRFFRAKNLNHMVRFLNNAIDTDGLVFSHSALNDAGFSDEDLKAGVTFDYEIYEEIPAAKAGETRINNEDGTWSITDANGNTTVYDGIHHIRQLQVKLIKNPDFEEGNVPTHEPEWIISLTSSADEANGDFYYADDAETEKKSVSSIRDYDAKEHHTLGGAPIFHNYYFEQKTAKIVINKKWDDYDDADEIRPESIHVKVISDEDRPLNKTVELKSDTHGHWKTTVELPVYSDKYDRTSKSMEKIKYTVAEVEEGVIGKGEAEGYSISYDTNMPFTLDENAEADKEVTVTNKHTIVPGAADGDETYGLKNQQQRGTPDYFKTPHNPMRPDSLVVPAGATKDGDGWVIIPGEGRYYLNSDDVGSVTFIPEQDYVGDPTPIQVHCIDKIGNETTVTYTPHVKEPKVESEDATRTIQFRYGSETGRRVTEDVKQKVTLTRFETEIDPKTGESKGWSDWTKDTFPAVPNPDDRVDEGWYTTDKVEELTVDKPGAVDDVYVIYHKKVYTVTFLDGEHGKSSGGSVKKEYGDRPQANKVTPEKGWRFTGDYDYVITDEDGGIIETGTTNFPPAIKVIGNIVFTPKYKQIDYTVTYKDGDHGKSSGGKEIKHYGDTPQANTVTPDNGWKFTGKYEYVITDEYGNVIDKGTTDDPSKIKVTGNIVFTPLYKQIDYTVTYKDGDHGRSSGGKEIKHYGDTPQANTVTPDNGWKFIGKYEYVITDENGKVIDKGTTDDPSKIKVTGNIVFTPLYEADPNGGGGGGSHRGSGMNTGDSNAVVPLACMAGACLAALIALIVMRRRRSR